MHRRLQLLLRLQNASSAAPLKANLHPRRQGEVGEKEEDAMAGCADPYEQQLLQVFQSCCGREESELDGKGLVALCDKLQLDEHTPHLLHNLLGPKPPAAPSITFPQFRDALLALLAAGITTNPTEFDETPGEREVTPKFVYGKKKYGRRSKPEEDGMEESESESDSAPSPTNQAKIKEDKMETSEAAKKRKTSQERAATASGSSSQNERTSWGAGVKRGEELSEEEECVRAVWEKLGSELGREELKLVCQATGLGGVADELVQHLFLRLGLHPSGTISFAQFLRLFRSGLGSLHDDLPSATLTPSSAPYQPLKKAPQEPRPFPGHSSNQPLYSSLDSFNSGMVSTEQLLEMWEAGGVLGAARLLHDLGLGAAARRPVSLHELAAALEEEAKALVEEQRDAPPAPNHSPLLSVLHASVLIYQAEAKSLKSSLEQAVCERNKLKQDLAEANERAALMAQEVDERHTRLEEACKKQIRLAEQKHGEEVRGLQTELSSDREQMAALTTGLELRMDQMQNEETKIRAELTTWLKKSELLEKENNQLKELLTESDSVKLQLQKRVDAIPDLQIRLSDLEREQAEIQAQKVGPLMEKLESLTSENLALRDANDELTLKLEQTAIVKKCVMETEEVEVVSPRGSSKRKGRPSGLCSEDSSEEETRPQGKQRRKTVPAEDSEETRQLRERVNELEKKLAECQERLQQLVREAKSRRETTPAPALTSHPLKQVFQVVRAQILEEILGNAEQLEDHPLLQEISRLQTRCQDLTQLQKTMEADFEMQLYDAKEEKEEQQLCNSPHNLKPSCSLPQSPRNLNQGESLLDSMEGSSKNVEQLEQECNHLKENLDQVKVEIVRILCDKEACTKENSALKEQITELATKVEVSTQYPSDSFKEEEESGQCEKIKQLEGRVKELESCLELMQDEYEKCEDYWQGKLDDERKLYELEQETEGKKFSELEEKIQELLSQEQEEANQRSRLSPIDERILMEQQVNDLEEECSDLRQRLKQSNARQTNGGVSEAAVQTDSPSRPKIAAHFSNSAFLRPSTSDKQIQANLPLEEVSQARNPYELISEAAGRKQHGPNGPSNGRTAGRPEQSCRVQLSVMQALSERLQQQEAKGRRLEATLAQHHYHLDRLVQQHHQELASLQTALQAAQIRLHQQISLFEQQTDKLACTDMLVKDLYLENALLLASVERLEKQCMFLTQHAPGSA